MKLDNEKQRETLINCIGSAQLSGMISELLPLLNEISLLIETVKTAPLEDTQEQQHGSV
jgi:hypothetical protein